MTITTQCLHVRKYFGRVRLAVTVTVRESETSFTLLTGQEGYLFAWLVLRFMFHTILSFTPLTNAHYFLLSMFVPVNWDINWSNLSNTQNLPV